MDLTDITSGVKLMMSSPPTGTKLRQFIDKAVRYYSRYNPVVDIEVIPIEDGEQIYDWPDDATGIRVVEWWPVGEPDAMFATEPDVLPFPPVLPHQPSLDVIRAINRAATAKRLRGGYKIVGKQIWLTQIPTSESSDIQVTYTMIHEFSEAIEGGGEILPSEAGYLTIPNEDLDIICDLTLAEINSAKGREDMMEPDYTEGMMSIKHRSNPASVREIIRGYRESVEHKYSRPIVSSS
jgi:hypothetical protein